MIDAPPRGKRATSYLSPERERKDFIRNSDCDANLAV